MMRIQAVLQQFRDLAEGDLQRWIEERWVRPDRDPDGYVFHEVDVARVRLIVELRHELAIDEEALPVVLSLLDEVYRLRAHIKTLCGAIEAQPWEVRSALVARLAIGAATGGEAEVAPPRGEGSG